jgi:hypothetical protein
VVPDCDDVPSGGHCEPVGSRAGQWHREDSLWLPTVGVPDPDRIQDLGAGDVRDEPPVGEGLDAPDGSRRRNVVEDPLAGLPVPPRHRALGPAGDEVSVREPTGRGHDRIAGSDPEFGLAGLEVPEGHRTVATCCQRAIGVGRKVDVAQSWRGRGQRPEDAPRRPIDDIGVSSIGVPRHQKVSVLGQREGPDRSGKSRRGLTMQGTELDRPRGQRPQQAPVDRPLACVPHDVPTADEVAPPGVGRQVAARTRIESKHSGFFPRRRHRHHVVDAGHRIEG